MIDAGWRGICQLQYSIAQSGRERERERERGLRVAAAMALVSRILSRSRPEWPYGCSRLCIEKEDLPKHEEQMGLQIAREDLQDLKKDAMETQLKGYENSLVAFWENVFRRLANAQLPVAITRLIPSVL
ncbi:hypothetical protein MUK42_06575 [Musa troglodytarum]|uniref:Uncharacterized protein n=1 Tax=Musa troglodytarum TaxID=320322 RepID=A0A9E7FVX6_9LILI|nr:hypothetical protein MUK42_06575 [Musa troglodytarum]